MKVAGSNPVSPTRRTQRERERSRIGAANPVSPTNPLSRLAVRARPLRPPREIPVALIDENPYQPRTTFEEGSIDELAQSILRFGLIQPLLVREAPEGEGRYQLVAGERRLRAVKSLKMERVMCVVQKTKIDCLEHR